MLPAAPNPLLCTPGKNNPSPETQGCCRQRQILNKTAMLRFPPLNGSFQRCRGERFMGGITQLPGGARAALASVNRPSLSMPDTTAAPMAAHPESSRLSCWQWLPSPVLCLPGLAWRFMEEEGGPEGTQTAPGLHPNAFPHCSHSRACAHPIFQCAPPLKAFKACSERLSCSKDAAW